MQADLARVHGRPRGDEADELAAWRPIVNDGTLTPQASSSVKVFGTETAVEVYKLLLGVLGPLGTCAPARRARCCTARSSRPGARAQINTFGGGVNEVQREIVATVGLGMTRASR